MIGPPVFWVGAGLPQLFLNQLPTSDSLGPRRTLSYLQPEVRELDERLRQKARSWHINSLSMCDAQCAIGKDV